VVVGGGGGGGGGGVKIARGFHLVDISTQILEPYDGAGEVHHGSPFSPRPLRFSYPEVFL